MSSLEQRISTLADRHAVITDWTAKLEAQLFELECLRDRLGQALRQPKNRCYRTAAMGVAPVLLSEM
jgi:hypothetical protein